MKQMKKAVTSRFQEVVKTMVLGNAHVVRSPADRLNPPVTHGAGSVQAHCLRATPHHGKLNISRSVSTEPTEISGFSNLTRAIPRSGPKSQPVEKPLSLLQ
jgi:hypothetical protein